MQLFGKKTQPRKVIDEVRDTKYIQNMLVASKLNVSLMETMKTMQEEYDQLVEELNTVKAQLEKQETTKQEQKWQ